MARLPLRRVWNAALVLASLVWLPWACAVWFDVDGVTWLIPSAVAFLPYVAAFTIVVALVAAAFRVRLALIVALLGVLLVVVPRLGRFAGDDQPAARGPVITVASSNLYGGRGDLRRLERIVRDGKVDVLALQENTAESDAAFRKAALGSRFRFWHSVPDPNANGAAGLAVLSRWPVEVLPAGDTRSVAVRIRVPGASTPLVVRSAHPYPPMNAQNLSCWRDCPPLIAKAPRDGDDAVLLGDYNATLDHHPIRNLLAAGFRDAADETGEAWRPTWSGGPNNELHLTIDHAFVSTRIAVEAFSVHDLPPSDHDVIVARLRLPR